MIKLTKEQENVLNRIIEWYENKSKLIEPFMILDGSAGTGKTTLIQELIRNIKGNIVCTAPTHKAVHVLAKNLDIKYSTIHKLLGLRPSFNINRADEKNFEQIGEVDMDYDLIIIDEYSMIPRMLENLIAKETKYNNCKILYVGDSLQLPAVDNNMIINNGYKNIVRLETIVRQKDDNPILDYIEILRDDIKNGKLNILSKLKSKVNNKNQGIEIYKDKNLFARKILNSFENNFKSNINSVRYLAYTNANIMMWNQFIRDKIINSDELVTINDILIGYENQLDEFNSVKLLNSNEYSIKSISKDKLKNIVCYKLKIENLINGDKSEIYIPDINDESFQDLVFMLEELIMQAKSTFGSKRKEKWKDFFLFKNNFTLMKEIPLTYDTIKKDIDYAYGLTIHKSQGSTFDEVFVNLIDILYPNGYVLNSDKNLIARLLYVAISRANKVNILYFK